MEAVSGASSALILLLTTMAALSVPVFGFQFQVGGHWGWTKPALNESDTYNEWAKWNRFHVGDSLRKFSFCVLHIFIFFFISPGCVV